MYLSSELSTTPTLRILLKYFPSFVKIAVSPIKAYPFEFHLIGVLGSFMKTLNQFLRIAPRSDLSLSSPVSLS